MNDALKHLQDRKNYFEEQIDSYHNYVEAAMATMQRGKGYDILLYIHSTSTDVATGKIDLHSLSPSNFFTFATCKNPAKLRSLVHSSTVPRLYTRKAYCCPSIHSLLDSLTRSISSFHQIRQEYLQWRYTTIPLALRIVSHLRTFEWRISFRPNSRIRHLWHYSVAWSWSTCNSSCIRSTKSSSHHMKLKAMY
jgi:hypothetical protein